LRKKKTSDYKKINTFLEGIAFEIYLYIIKNNLDIDENPFLKIKGDLQYHLGKLIKENLIEKDYEGRYIIREENVLDTLLGYLLHKNEGDMRRIIFYFVFAISSLVIFIIYLVFLPRTSSTTEIYFIGFTLFSFTAFSLEAIVTRSRMRMLEKLIQ